MRTYSHAAIALVACIAVTSAVAEELSLGRFSVSWLDGFTHVQGTNPAIYRGPTGERVRITAEAARRQRTAEEARAEVRSLVGVASQQFREMESEFGRPLWPLRVNAAPTGEVHISSAIESNAGNKPGFVFNYAVISPAGDFSLIMVAGDGDAFEAFAKFKEPLASARWR